tara:strand:+ start:105 stop:503 length:399 start_codon:yes stop_codon:yes gene_type:complete
MTDSYQTQLSCACLLLSVAEADEILDEQELYTIKDILQDFFSITKNNAQNLLDDATQKKNNATGLFEFGQYLNGQFDYADKLDFISCILEVAFADGNLHYLEHHTVKKIANILHINREDILVAKADIEKFLD